MTKEIFEKVLIPQGIFNASDMTAEEKKWLYQEMEQLGASQMMAYTRFFRDGFATWEIEGIVALKAAFIKHLQTNEKVFVEVRNVGENSVDGNDPVPVYRHFYRIPPKATEGESFDERSFDLNKAGDFWRFLGDITYRQRFGEWMAERGMKSYTTVMRRFSTEDWRDWERVGIRSFVEDFQQKYLHP